MKSITFAVPGLQGLSSPARGTWVEILDVRLLKLSNFVVSRTGDVG